VAVSELLPEEVSFLLLKFGLCVLTYVTFIYFVEDVVAALEVSRYYLGAHDFMHRLLWQLVQLLPVGGRVESLVSKRALRVFVGVHPLLFRK
jgi:hypothetical protein